MTIADPPMTPEQAVAHVQRRLAESFAIKGSNYLFPCAVCGGSHVSSHGAQDCAREETGLSPFDFAQAVEWHRLMANRIVRDLVDQIEAAHVACDGPVSRMGMGGPRPLAERVSAVRQMVDDRCRDAPPEPELTAAEERMIDGEPIETDTGLLIVACIASFILGIFCAWCFLVFVH